MQLCEANKVRSNSQPLPFPFYVLPLSLLVCQKSIYSNANDIYLLVVFMALQIRQLTYAVPYLPLEKLETTPYKKYKKVSMLTLTNRTSQ